MKKVYDSIHGFIHFNELEGLLIDSLPFQRLRCIHQLGITNQVYPGATHTRFEHSLGVMHLAAAIFDHIFREFPLKDKEYARQMVRLGALSHDLGHLPFSHVSEKALLGKEGHEKWTLNIIKSSYLLPVWEAISKEFPGKDVEADVIKLSIGEDKLKELDLLEKYPFTPMERVLSRLVSGDFFGADRMDYLLRDSKCTGVAYGFFDYHQLIEMLRILPVENGLELGIEENGIESCEALLLARMFMHKRVYQYSSVKSYSFHLARFMKAVYDNVLTKSIDAYLSYSDHEVLTEMRRATKDSAHPGHFDALAVLAKGKRFKALAFTGSIEEKHLEELTIPKGHMAWELSKNCKGKKGLSFPVITANETIIPGSKLSEIEIPSGSPHWIYIDPTHEKLLLEILS